MVLITLSKNYFWNYDIALAPTAVVFIAFGDESGQYYFRKEWEVLSSFNGKIMTRTSLFLHGFPFSCFIFFSYIYYIIRASLSPERVFMFWKRNPQQRQQLLHSFFSERIVKIITTISQLSLFQGFPFFLCFLVSVRLKRN